MSYNYFDGMCLPFQSKFHKKGIFINFEQSYAHTLQST